MRSNSRAELRLVGRGVLAWIAVASAPAQGMRVEIVGHQLILSGSFAGDESAFVAQALAKTPAITRSSCRNSAAAAPPPATGSAS
jgi:hypothetical protein